MKRFAWLLLGMFLGLGMPARAWAKVVRYAVIVGNNRGAAHEEELRYAEADARKLFDTLRTLGDFPTENMVLLQAEDASSFERVLITLNDRIRSENGTANESMLFVYYSGHADADALHLGRSRLEIERLRKLVRGSSADFRMVVLDSCRSGALTRVKGGRRTAPFALTVEDQLAGEGLVLMSSSAAGEDAQESDALKGSFFTHYFVSGLRGAADTNGDGVVSVEEAYAHAYQHTIRASSQTLHGVQHPTFEFDLRGQGRIALTRVNRRDRGQLSLPPGRGYLVFAGHADGPVVAEIGANDRRRSLVLDEGRYFIRGRGNTYLLEGLVSLRSGENKQLDDASLTRIEYARLARKGGAERQLAHGPQAGYQLRTSLWRGGAPCHGARLGYAIDLRWLTVTPRIGWCRAGYENERIEATADELDIDVVLTRVFDLRVVSIGIGIGGGASWLRQGFQTQGIAPPRNTIAGHVDAVLDLTWDLPRGFYLLTQISASLYAVEQQRGDDVRAAIVALFAGRPVVMVGKRF